MSDPNEQVYIEEWPEGEQRRGPGFKQLGPMMRSMAESIVNSPKYKSAGHHAIRTLTEAKELDGK